MCSEHGCGCVCPVQDCFLSAGTLMPSLCYDQGLGLAQPVSQGFLLPARKALPCPASPHSASPANGILSPKELRILSLIVQQEELQKSADFPLPDKTFPVFQKLLAKALFTDSELGVERT